jgi:N-acetyl-anhydromuramyl-L-alanine amidase AmpD
MNLRFRLLPLAGTALFLLSCSELSPVAPDDGIAVCAAPAASLSHSPDATLPLDTLFAAAEREFGVPAALLAAIGYVETRWQMVEGHPEFPGQPAAYGIMALKGDQLAQGAELAGVSAEEAGASPGANIRAAAALLRSYADEMEIDRADLGGWAPVVARYSGIALPEGRAAYVHDDVYGTLRRGVPRGGGAPGSDAAVEAVAAVPRFDAPRRALATTTASVDHAAAVWRASPNFNARPAGAIGRVAMVVIHSCEGSYTGCWSWLANPDSRVSAHYVVREDGAEITQLVRESERGWHIGSTYECRLNRNFDCWRNGQSNNHFTIGIEHAGYASQRSWPVAQLDASARLVCEITRRHGIARDDIHVLGHAQLQPHNRTDPGAGWPWAHFRSRIDAHCGGSQSGELIVDSNNADNDPATGRIEVSASWISTRATPGYHGSGYFFAPTGAEADPAFFRFYLAAPATRSVDAWWTAGANRSPRAAYHAVDAAGRQLGTVQVDQRADGGRWNPLGSWHFPAGWNSIQLSRAGPRGCVVIADAVRVR